MCGQRRALYISPLGLLLAYLNHADVQCGLRAAPLTKSVFHSM